MFMVCGEALMDVFATGATPTGMALDARIGGSPFNVALGLARMAQPVAMFACVSRGFLGERLMRALVTEGVNVALVQRSDAPTTLGLVGLDEKGVASYSFYGEGCADRLLAQSALSAVPAGLRAISIGSYTTVTEPTASTLRALAEREHGRTLIAYDPNVRLNVEPDLARWRDVLQWMLSRTDLLKVSDEDLHLLMPGRPLAEFAASALAQGVKLVVITRGDNGAMGWTAQAHVSVPPVKVNVIDTVGAGDTFQAALLTWLAEHDALNANALGALTQDQLSAALAFAARAAAITCSRRGADMPRRAELG